MQICVCVIVFKHQLFTLRTKFVFNQKNYLGQLTNETKKIEPTMGYQSANRILTSQHVGKLKLSLILGLNRISHTNKHYPFTNEVISNNLFYKFIYILCVMKKSQRKSL